MKENMDVVRVNLTFECRDCEVLFKITAKERLFFHKKGLNLPKRCKPCRLKAKRNKEMYHGLHESMNNNDKMRSRTKPRSNATKNFDGYRM